MRAHRPNDFPATAAMWADPEVVRYITGQPSTPEQSWSRLLRQAGHWALLGYGGWAVEERSTGIFVGEVGFADYQRKIEPSLDGTPEVGWVLAPSAHGKGYATEAVLAALSWGDRHFDTAVRFACIVSPQNLASIRVAEKCGFTLARETTYQQMPTLLFLRVRRETHSWTW